MKTLKAIAIAIRCLAILVGSGLLALGLFIQYDAPGRPDFLWAFLPGLLLVLPWNKIKSRWAWGALYSLHLLMSFFMVLTCPLWISFGWYSHRSVAYNIQGAIPVAILTFMAIANPFALVYLRKKSENIEQ